MTGVVPLVPRLKFTYPGTNLPLSGGSVTVYLAGTTTLANVFQDQGMLSAQTNPVPLDANGEALFWVDSSATYKFLVKDSVGATITGWPVDNIPGGANTAAATQAAQDWAQYTGGDVPGSVGGRSSKSWAQDSLAGITYGGSAKDWAQSASSPDGVGKSAKSYAADAASSANALLTGQAAGVVGFDTLANLNLTLTYADKTVAYVTNDTTVANNGIYRKSGASGAGSWVFQSTFATNYAGVATPATNPGAQAATSRIFYTASTPGTYTNFGALVVNTGEIAALRWTGAAWTKDTMYTFNTPNVIFGEVVKGAIYPKDVGNTNQVVVAVQTGTVIVGYNNTKKVHITVTAGDNLTIDRSTTHSGIDLTSTGLLYCSLAGQLGITNGTTNLPSGEYVLIGYLYAGGTATTPLGAGSATLGAAPILPTNHFFYQRANDMACWPKQDNKLVRMNIKDLGAVGDGATDDLKAFQLWHYLVLGMRSQFVANGWWSRRKTPYELFFPSGTYLVSSLTGISHVDDKWVGDGKTVSTVKYTGGLGQMSIYQIEDLGLWNIALIQGTPPDACRYYRAKFKFDPAVINSGIYLVNPGTKDYEVQECEWDYAAGTCYIPLYVSNFRNVIVERNVFNAAGTGTHSHAVRIENPGSEPQSVTVRGNKQWNGTTGFFFGSNRLMPTENVLVEHNRVFNVQEEGIAFDGFGNNTGLCPVIGSGTITAVSNDANGRLVITPALLYNPAGTPNQSLAISARSDWTNFYFAFEGGNGSTAALSEGIDGTYVRIYAYDGTAGTLTLDSYMTAADVATGGTSLCGVHAGFFNVTVRHNTVEGSVGTAGSTLHTYATGISVFLNVFGFQVYGNRLIACAGGINVAGGQMLTTYRSLAWNVHVFDNDFINCTRLNAVLQDQGAVRFESYGLTVNQYNNSFHHNTVIGATRMKFDRQRNFTCEGNTMPGVTSVVRQYCAQALPTAGAAWMGRTKELITEDGSGNATDIHYYMCKAVGSVYSWVQIA